MSNVMNFNSGVSGRYRYRLVDLSQPVSDEQGWSKWIKNRIVDAGMSAFNLYYLIGDWFLTASCGTNNNATTDDMTQLVSYLAHSRTYVTGNNALTGYTFDSSTKSLTNRRTFTVYTNSSGSTVNVGELGVGNANTSNPAIYSRIALNTPVAVATGLSLQITYELKVSVPRMQTGWAGSLTIGSQTQAGYFFMSPGGTSGDEEDAYMTILGGYVNTSGVSSNASYLYSGNALFGGNASGSYDKYGINADIINTSDSYLTVASLYTDLIVYKDYPVVYNDPSSVGSWVSEGSGGIWTRRIPCTLTINDGPGRADVYTIGCGFAMAYSGAYSVVYLGFHATSPFTKAVGKQWDINFDFTWTRV